MATTKLTGTLIRSGSIPTTALGGGVFSSSVQLSSALPSGTVSSSAQVKPLLPDGTVSSSTQYPGWVTASSQVQLNGITGTTFSNAAFSFPQNLNVGGTLTAREIQTEYVTSSIIYESGSTKFGDTADDTHQFTGSLSVLGTISGALILPSGVVTASSQIDITATTNYTTFSSSLSTVDRIQTARIDSLESLTSSYAINSTIQSQLAGVVSSSTQVQPLLPNGTVSSSTQVTANLPAGVVSSSGQVDITATTNYATFSSSIATKNDSQDAAINTLSGATGSYALQTQLAGVASSSSQVKAFLPTDTVSSSAQVKAFLPADTVSSSGQVNITATTNYATFSSSIATKNDLQDVSINALNTATSSYAINSTIQGQLAGVVSSSTQVKPLLPDGTVSSSAQVTANLPAGVVSSSAQLPAGTVSSSGQVDITATTNYTTFSSSLATVDQNQQSEINGLKAATGSYAINATIQGQLAGVASSSSQVKAFLPADTVSSSAQYPGWVTASSQVDITATTNYTTFSSSIATKNDVQDVSINALNTATSSYAINATIQSQLAGVVSSSTQVKPLLPDGTVSSSGQVVVQNTTGIGALATTGSNTFNANQTITGSLFISQNLTVLGSSSIGFISQSTLDIGTNIITVNTLSPGTRFGGLSVIDSGSSPKLSGSIFFDSLKDEWIFIHQQAAGAGVTSSLFLMGPQTFNDVGNETNLTTNKIPKSQNAEHLSDSQISDNGVTVSITNGLTVGTNLTASNATISGLTANQAVFTDANDQLVSVATTGTGDVVRAASPTLTGTLTAANITATGTMLLAGIISQSSQVGLTGTTGYSTFSSSIATKNDLQDVSINALNAATSSYAVNSTIQGQLAGVVSSSTQVKPLLPGGTVSSSAQFPGWVTASSQVTITGISGLGANVATFLATPSSANLATAVTDETGTGALVFAGSPTLTGTVTANNIVMSGSQFSGIVSGSGLDYRLVVPVGTNQYAT